jgi:hypothetical protein
LAAPVASTVPAPKPRIVSGTGEYCIACHLVPSQASEST